MEPRDIELLMYGLEYRIAEGSSTITALKKMAEQETNGCTECLNYETRHNKWLGMKKMKYRTNKWLAIPNMPQKNI